MERLSGLEHLDLSNNKLKSLPRAIGSLRNLKYLNVKKNYITELPGSMSLMVNLRELLIGHNEISEIPVVVGALELEKLDAEENPFMKLIPRDVTPDGLIEYFKEEFKTTGLRNTVRMKVVLLGRNGVGKASLLKQLKGSKKAIRHITYKSSKRTEDILEFTEFASKDSSLLPSGTNLHFVACQFSSNIHFATHQFFLSPHSMYIIVFNLLHPEEENSFIEYWLKTIHERSPNSAIIICGTHSDDKKCTREYIDNVFMQILTNTQAETRYPNLKYLYDVSCTNGTNIRAVRKTIATITSEIMKTKIPESYLNLEEKINALLEADPTPPILKKDSFVQVALASGVEKNKILPAIDHLSSVGTLMYIDKEKLNDKIILDSRWLVDAFIALEDAKDLLEAQGILSKSKLKEIWTEPLFPSEYHSFLLSVFEEYGAYYTLEGGELLFFPWLLPSEPSENFKTCWVEDSSITEQIRYYAFENAPSTIFSEIALLFLNNEDLVILSFWMNGIVMEDKQETAKIFVSYEIGSSTLKLRVRGDNQVLKMVSLDEAIDTLVTDSLRIPYEVKIPCRHCLNDERITTPHIFTQTELEKSVKESKMLVNCCGGTKPKAIKVDWLAPDIAMTTFSGQKIEFKDIILDDNIGEGGYASVFKGTWNNSLVAVKQIKLVNIVNKNDNIFADFRREVQLMSGLKNENLVVLKAICMEPFCMVLEYMEKGSLYDYVRSDDWNNVDWPSRLYLALDIAKGMTFLHGMMPPIVHRDLKSPNILLTMCQNKNRLRAKVADFGLSKSLRFTSKLDGKALEGHNPVWLAPEILLQKNYNEKVDVYSYGIIMYEMLTRKDYFGEYSFMSDVEAMVIEGKRPDLIDIGEPYQAISDSFKSLIQDCWDNNPEVRPCFKDIVKRIENMLTSLNIELEENEENKENEDIKEIEMSKPVKVPQSSIENDILSKYKDMNTDNKEE